MKYTDIQRLQKVISIIEQLNDYLEENQITEESIENSYSVQWTVTTPLYNIGEHIYNISAEFKKDHPDIPWSRISGLRHRLVHDYEGTNWEIICQVLFQELPVFLGEIKTMMTIDDYSDNK